MNKLFVFIITLFILCGCSSSTNISNENVFIDEDVDVGPIYTYEGFYEGFEASEEEQAIIDSRVMHITEMNLLPTAEYSLEQYPLYGVRENEYISNHQEEIIEFLEARFSELSVVEIDIREDLVFEYRKFNPSEGCITYRFDAIGNEYPGYYNDVDLNVDLLNTKKPNDEWDSNILQPSFEDGNWYLPYQVYDIISFYYNKEITDYFSKEVGEINDYLNSTGHYFDLANEDCGYFFSSRECYRLGSVFVEVGISQKVSTYYDTYGEYPEEYKVLIEEDSYSIEHYFSSNKMTVEEVLEFVNNSEYFSFSFKIQPFISMDVFEENNLRDLANNYTEGLRNTTMKEFTDNNLEWIINDKNTIKKIIEESGVSYTDANFTVSVGYIKADPNVYDDNSNHCKTIDINKDDYPWLTEDVYFGEMSDWTHDFYWTGNE